MTKLDPGLRDLAIAQEGVFSSRQAQTMGVSLATLADLARHGDIVRVRKGAYRLPLAAGVSPEQVYAADVRAVLSSRHPRTWASHHAALALAGLPLVGPDLGRIDLCIRPPVDGESKTAPRGTASFRRSGVVTHPLPLGEMCVVRGMARSISTESAIVLTAGHSGARAAVVALDAALHRGLVTRHTVASALARGPWNTLATRRADAALALADPLCESPGESLTRLMLDGLGWTYRSQVDLRDAHGFIGRVDFLVGDRVVVEFDGLVKYAGADGRAALVAEKRREDRLRAAGFAVVRVTWADLRDPAAIVRRIRAAAAGAAVRPT